jgi:hypothetical protein
VVREIAVAAAVTYAVVSIPVAAQVGETGNQFYARCQAEAGKADGQCDTYIQGVADTLAAFGKGGNANGICGRGYNRGQLSRIYLTWARRNRTTGSLPRLAGVTFALREAFPCRVN